MTRKLFILPLLLGICFLGACTLSCSHEFEKTNGHVLEAAQDMYEARADGLIDVEVADKFKADIDDAYGLVKEGSELCESNEDAAADKFKEAEDILDEIDGALKATGPPDTDK